MPDGRDGGEGAEFGALEGEFEDGAVGDGDEEGVAGGGADEEGLGGRVGVEEVLEDTDGLKGENWESASVAVSRVSPGCCSTRSPVRQRDSNELGIRGDDKTGVAARPAGP